DLTFFYVQAERGEEAADRSEHCEVVVANNGQFEMLVGHFRHGEFAGMVGGQRRGKMNMACDRRWIEAPKVLRIHATEKIVQDVRGDVLAKGRNYLVQLFLIRWGSGHGRQYISTGCSLCAVDVVSIMPRHGSPFRTFQAASSAVHY